mmetsp:Transcript_63558/g.189391  ORF Transcript_63558/g.189391 Transcript_63558/m.189391 type:complete len:201 (-) Transcript_63558:100-702(-)
MAAAASKESPGWSALGVYARFTAVSARMGRAAPRRSRTPLHLLRNLHKIAAQLPREGVNWAAACVPRRQMAVGAGSGPLRHAGSGDGPGALCKIPAASVWLHAKHVVQETLERKWRAWLPQGTGARCVLLCLQAAGKLLVRHALLGLGLGTPPLASPLLVRLQWKPWLLPGCCCCWRHRWGEPRLCAGSRRDLFLLEPAR